MDKIIINKPACDGCGACVTKCPKDVLTLIELSDDEIKELSFKGRIIVKWKGRKKAFIQFPEFCTQCGICKKSCHLRAIEIAE